MQILTPYNFKMVLEPLYNSLVKPYQVSNWVTRAHQTQ
jgi:hypothetical protein